MKPRHFLAAAGALALAACGSADTANEAAASDTASDTAAPDTAPAIDIPVTSSATTPQAFVDAASASDAYEIEAGRLAQTRGKSQEVKEFGATMVMDHSTSTANLKAAAAQVPDVTVDPRMTALQQNNLGALRNAGDTFDTIYAQQQVSAHEQALRLLRDYAGSGSAAPLKAFASDTIATVEGHLVKARDLP